MSSQSLSQALSSLKKSPDTNPIKPKNPYISRPSQLRALELADKFNDRDHKILYLKLCKTLSPALIDQAESFVSDANATNPAALFMWKVKQLRQEYQAAGKTWQAPPSPPTQKKSSSKKNTLSAGKPPKNQSSSAKKTSKKKPAPISLFD